MCLRVLALYSTVVHFAVAQVTYAGWSAGATHLVKKLALVKPV